MIGLADLGGGVFAHICFYLKLIYLKTRKLDLRDLDLHCLLFHQFGCGFCAEAPCAFSRLRLGSGNARNKEASFVFRRNFALSAKFLFLNQA
jgi:hypothetical protein